MLSNPLTPPNEDSSESVSHPQGHNALATSASTAQHPQEQFATPVSNASMGLDDMDGRSDQEERSSFPDVSDEDEDMDEPGGAPFTISPAHAYALNAELDELDAELMGPENMAQLWDDAYLYQGDEEIYLPHHHYAMNNEPVQPPQPPQEEDDDEPGEFSGLMVEDAPMQGTNASSDLPTTMSEVSLQLQQIHDGQEHGDNAEVAEELHGAFLDNNSIPSILLPIYSNMFTATSASEPTSSQAGYIFMPLLSSAFTAPPAQPPIAPHLWSTEGFTPLALNVLLPTQSGSGIENAVNIMNAIFNDDMSDADNSEVEDQYNLSVRNFLQRWGEISAHQRHHDHGPSLAALEQQRHTKLPPMLPEDLRGDQCDIQRINWEELGVTRQGAKQMRRKTYRNYTNLRYERQWHPRLHGARLADDRNFFRFRRMDFSHNVHLSHFQLRNLIACPTPDHIFYAGKSKVLHWNPTQQAKRQRPTVAMNLTDPSVQPFNGFPGSGIQISTLTVAHDILVAGGFCGEYGLVNLRGQRDVKHTEGLIIDHSNSITNHVQVHLSRQSYLPQAIFASNDTGVRVLDINTNKFISEHMYDHAINCSAISPDQRLRVLVGDTRQVMICNADTGEVLQSLDGHRDYGFACDWADDGWTVATGNQDMQIKIWDARKWTTRDGRGNPVATIAAEMAGVRKLKFSPLGSGKKVLLAAEPADFVNVIDASTYDKKQTLSFFGEIGGVDFTNDGQNIWVANCDDMRGGLMEFERCGLADYGHYQLEREQTRSSQRHSRHAPPAGGYDWVSDDAELIRHPKARGTQELRERRAAALGVNMGFF